MPPNLNIVDLPPGAMPGEPSGTAIPEGGSMLPDIPGLSVLPHIETINDDSVVNSPDLSPPRKRGRPSKVDAAARLNSVTPPPPRPPVAPTTYPLTAPKVDHEMMAQTVANMWFNLGSLFLGEDWVPESDEVQPIKNGFKDYFVSINAPEIPPVWGLVTVLTLYTVKRLQKPTIKTRLFGVFSWVKNLMPSKR